jgi:alpha-1,2-mannosyltransferase
LRAGSGGRFESVVLPLLLLLAVFGIYAVTTERHAVNTDAYAASAGAWRIATAGTPWFDDLDVKEINGTHGVIGGGNSNGQWLSPSPNGHVAPQRSVGPIVAGVPFYWALSDGGDESDFNLLPGGLTASLLSALAVMLLFLAMRQRASTVLALSGAVVFALATPTWSLSANGLWTHPLTQFGIAGAAYAASRSRWWLAGVFLAAGMLGRPHLALIAAVLGLGVAWTRRDWLVAVGVALPTTASLVLVALWNRAVHGVWSITGSYTDVVDRATQGVEAVLGDDLLTNYLGFLVSFDRGFLVWTPVLLLFVPALLLARYWLS